MNMDINNVTSVKFFSNIILLQYGIPRGTTLKIFRIVLHFRRGWIDKAWMGTTGGLVRKIANTFVVYRCRIITIQRIYILDSTGIRSQVVTFWHVPEMPRGLKMNPKSQFRYPKLKKIKRYTSNQPREEN